MAEFYKLWSKTVGSPIWYGDLDGDTIAEKLAEIIDAYETFLEFSQGYKPYYEILKNFDYHLEEIDIKKPNTGFEKDRKIIEAQQGCINIKKVKEHYMNQIKYVEKVKDNREFQKEVIIGRREKLANDSKLWREKHQAKIKQKVNCPCGGSHTLSNKSRHTDTIKHQKYIEATGNK